MSKSCFISIVMAVCLAACGRDTAPANAQTATTTGDQELPAVLATIRDETITMEDVRALRRAELDQLDAQYRRERHKLVQSTLQEIIRDRLLAAEATRQGKTIDQLIEAAVGRSLDPTEADVAAWYAENQARVGPRTLDQVRPQIVQLLRTERRQIGAAALEARLMRERKLVVHLQPFRVQFDNSGAPTKGREDAPVTLVEFSDFQCPFCSRFTATLERVEQDFGDKLLMVYRQFPLSRIHPHAFKAAEASLCANEQGKFWELHDLMFEEQKQLGVPELKEKASRLGMDAAAFAACLDSGKHADRVRNDYQEGTMAGVTGTPAVFINGEPLEGGAVGYETIAAAIERELARSGK
jgi:protein-disulfide isomerase